MGSMSLMHWLIVLAVVVLVFGTKRLRGAGGDIGAAVKNFKTAMKEGDAEATKSTEALRSGETVTPPPAADRHNDKV